MDRDWTAVAASKQAHWAHEFRERGPEATFEAASILSEHLRAVNPAWPSDDERRDDLAHHVALKRTIDRTAGAFAPLAAR